MTSDRILASRMMQDTVEQLNREAVQILHETGVTPKELLAVNCVPPGVGRAAFDLFNERLPRQDCYALLIDGGDTSIFAMLFLR